MLRKWINTFVEHEYAADWEHISAWHYDEDADDMPGGDVLFPDGFDQILRLLTAGLDIVRGAEVRSMSPAVAGVRLRLADGTVLAADHVVVTVPLGVLVSGRIEFAAPLARSRQRAIGTLRTGLLNKCCLRFDRVSWPDGADWLQWLGPRDGLWGEWVDLAHCTGAPVLMGFNAGAEAAEIERLDDAAAVASAHEALKSMFGSGFPMPRAAQITRWGQDQYALGSYSYNAIGTRPATRKKLAGADWDGALVFAGEATSARFFGSAHGAILSGRKAARQILKQRR
jgi:monoamine oxidase